MRPKFKVGQRVRVTRSSADWDAPVGTLGTVASYDGANDRGTDWAVGFLADGAEAYDPCWPVDESYLEAAGLGSFEPLPFDAHCLAPDGAWMDEVITCLSCRRPAGSRTRRADRTLAGRAAAPRRRRGTRDRAPLGPEGRGRRRHPDCQHDVVRVPAVDRDRRAAAAALRGGVLDRRSGMGGGARAHRCDCAARVRPGRLRLPALRGALVELRAPAAGIAVSAVASSAAVLSWRAGFRSRTLSA